MIQLPTYKQIVNRIRADVAANLPGTDPTIYGSYLRALADSLGGRAYDLVLLTRQLVNELFPQTSSGEYLERWAGYEGLARKIATPATGPVTLIGPLDVPIIIGAQFRAETATGFEIYTLSSSVILATQNQNIGSLTRSDSTATATTGSNHRLATGVTVTISGAKQIIVNLSNNGAGLATAVTSSDHFLATGNNVTISGADQTEYNGTFVITEINSTTFTYPIATIPAGPATGSPVRAVPEYDGAFPIVVTSTTTFTYDVTGTPPVTASGASLSWVGGYGDMQAINAGAATNLASGAQLTPVTPIGGVEITGIAQFDGVSGGTDTESDDALKIRTLQSRSNPVANFNQAAIEKLVLSVPGVTRVNVKRIFPGIGDVTIMFMRDDDLNPIPNAAAIQEVKDVVYPIVPAQSSIDDVHILAPVAVVQNFVFSLIDPNTKSMQEAIRQNLAAFFKDEVIFDTTVTSDKYRAAIINTIDPANGDTLTSFELNEPTGDIVVTDQPLEQDVLNLQRVGPVVIVETDGPHGLFMGQQVTIAGADQLEYNGTFAAMVTSDSTFTYTITTTPDTPATGTITVGSLSQGAIAILGMVTFT